MTLTAVMAVIAVLFPYAPLGGAPLKSGCSKAIREAFSSFDPSRGSRSGTASCDRRRARP
jgi:hypothetical protein